MASLIFIEQGLGQDEIIIIDAAITSLEFRGYSSRLYIHLVNGLVVSLSIFTTGREPTREEREEAVQSIARAYKEVKSLLHGQFKSNEVHLAPFVSFCVYKQEEP